MSKTKHTPGPWRVDSIRKKFARISAGNGTGGGWLNHTKVHVSTGGETSPEGIANARLIAAAPELLEALEALEKDCHYLKVSGARKDWTNLERAQAAIAKAKGQ